jgi:hypothetical protein
MTSVRSIPCPVKVNNPHTRQTGQGAAKGLSPSPPWSLVASRLWEGLRSEVGTRREARAKVGLACPGLA